MSKNAVLYYDGECSLCKTLAEFTLRRCRGRIEIAPWSGEVLETIALKKEGTLFKGREAWEQMLMLDPYLKQLHWLARKIGLSSVLAGSLMSLSKGAKRMCRGCSRRY